MNEMRTSEVLDLAADEIHGRGWTQGGGWPGEESFGGSGNGICLEGGIMAAAGIEFGSRVGGVFWEDALTTCPAYLAVKEYLDYRCRLFTWNDRYAKSAEEVIEVLRAAAAVERAKEAAPALHLVTCGDIGEDQREFEFEPLTTPATPITVPSTPAPLQEPVPA